MGRVINDVAYCYASMVVCRGVPGVMVGVKVSSDDIVIVVEKVGEKGGTILVIYVSCESGRSGWYVAVCDMKGGVSV